MDFKKNPKDFKWNLLDLYGYKIDSANIGVIDFKNCQNFI
jgi:hypothetical protein